MKTGLSKRLEIEPTKKREANRSRPTGFSVVGNKCHVMAFAGFQSAPAPAVFEKWSVSCLNLSFQKNGRRQN